MHRHRPAPARLGQRDLAARPGPPLRGHRRGVHPGRLRPGRPAAVRHLPRQGLDRRQRLARRDALGHRASSSPARSWSAGPCCGWPGGVFYGLGDPPSEDPEMAEMAAEETSETERASSDPADHDRPARRARRRAAGIGLHPAARAGRPGGRDPVPGPGRLQRHRAVRRAHRPSGGPSPPPNPPGSPLSAVLTGARLGHRGAGPGLPRAVLAAPAAAAPRIRARRRADGAHPALPERRDQRLRHLDRPRPGGLGGALALVIR